MKFVLLIIAIVCFAIAAVFCFTGSAAINPLGLVALGLCFSTGSRVIA
jgi:hypothetical protein